MSLGPQTKAAIARLIGVLPYLHSEGTSVPTAAQADKKAILDKYAQNHVGDGTVDPKVSAATAYAEEELEKAIEADKSGEQPKEKAKSGDGLTIVSNGEEPVQVYQPKSEETSDEELDLLTKPEPQEGAE